MNTSQADFSILKRRGLSVGCGSALILGVLLLPGCVSSEQPVAERPDLDLTTQCADPRPKVCTMEYRPVCAELADGNNQTYPSPCNACADVAVSAWRAEPCEEI